MLPVLPSLRVEHQRLCQKSRGWLTHPAGAGERFNLSLVQAASSRSAGDFVSRICTCWYFACSGKLTDVTVADYYAGDMLDAA